MELHRTDVDHLRSVFLAVENGDIGMLKSLGIKVREVFHKKKLRKYVFCLKGGGGIYRRENVTYSLQCNSCLQQGVPKVYWGESSRTLLQRGKEHWSAYVGKSDASVLHKHETEHHQNVPAEWKMKVYNSYKTTQAADRRICSDK